MALRATQLGGLFREKLTSAPSSNVGKTLWEVPWCDIVFAEMCNGPFVLV